ncbi:phosphoribosyltransferase family protein [Terrimonas rubra]|uniref:Phosphoribosyltransferase family protein n=1 Tax=Terrimonas rubra TaxID=1035890 RepID=A0ABW6A8E6_9BACT
MTANKHYILVEQTALKKMQRMALEILENNAGETELIIAGIDGGGTIVARTMHDLLKQLDNNLTLHLANISLNKRQPEEVLISPELDYNNKVVIVVDDVANSGRTLLYALKPLLNWHPKKIQTLALVGRHHNSFPVYPDYVGMELATTMEDHIYVEVDGNTVKGAYLQ